ncbi:MaoC family dehydratase [Rhodococcus pyridinivorans]|uniref:MaoC family dehydratase n=1 Tax=Rhodococcus pyridinivorans TaxID=103816 RepID=UPI002227D806|nr:MaoC family dehydratase [Rhodococcus pyridinivorans]MCW3472814.1 MaoC family dehydratase [Rhodococcus pyridinivorans]
MKVFDGIAELAAAQGTDLGASEWVLVEQDRINQFADATGDHQWIHVDPERAKDGPFGAAIAHGFLTLSMMPVLQHELYRVDGVTMTVNYGLNKVRFVTPVRVGSRIRARATIGDVTQLDGAVQIELHTTIEIEGSDKPACVAVSIARFVA